MSLDGDSVALERKLLIEHVKLCDSTRTRGRTFGHKIAPDLHFSRADATNGNITQGYQGLLLVGKSRIKILGADDFQVYSSKETTSG